MSATDWLLLLDDRQKRIVTKEFAKHGLVGWCVVVENLQKKMYFDGRGHYRDGVLGLCDREQKTIRIDHLDAGRPFRQTLLHEMAHALTPDDNAHGAAWLKKAEELGCTQAHLWPYCLRLMAA